MTSSTGGQARGGASHPLPACRQLRHQQQEEQVDKALRLLLAVDPRTKLGRQLLPSFRLACSEGHAAAVGLVTRLRLDLAEELGVPYAHQLSVLLGTRQATALTIYTPQISGLVCAWAALQQRKQEAQQQQQLRAAYEELLQQQHHKSPQQNADAVVGGAVTAASLAASSNDTASITVTTPPRQHSNSNNSSSSGSGSAVTASAPPPRGGLPHRPGAKQQGPCFTQLTLLGPLSPCILRRLIELLDVLPGTEHLGCVEVAANAGAALSLKPSPPPGLQWPHETTEVIQRLVHATTPRRFSSYGHSTALLPRYIMSTNNSSMDADNSSSSSSSSSSRRQAAHSLVRQGGSIGGSWRSSCPTLLVGDTGPTSLRAVAPLLKALPRLAGLYLPGTVAQQLPQCADILQPLQALHVAGGIFRECVPVLPTLTNLRHLSMEENVYWHVAIDLPDACSSLVHLSSLAFRYTPVTDQGLALLCGAASSLKRLELNRVPHITALPDAITRHTDLHTLGLWESHVLALPQGFTALKRLREMAWVGDAAAADVELLWDLPNLEYLVIGDTINITSISDKVSQLQRLQQLHIWADRVQELPDSITTLVGLQRFSVRSQQLLALPAGITALSKLSCIALDCDQLQALPPDVQAFVDARKPQQE